MLKTILSTFLLVFLAELGDKTQLATMLLSSKSNYVMAVFIGSSIALVASSFIGVFAGVYMSKHVPQNYITNISGALFIVIGVLILFKKI